MSIYVVTCKQLKCLAEMLSHYCSIKWTLKVHLNLTFKPSSSASVYHKLFSPMLNYAVYEV